MDVIREPKPIKVNCWVCGKEFTALRKSARYCSYNCSKTAHYRASHSDLTDEEFEILNNKRIEQQRAREQKNKKVDNIEKVLKENNGNYAEYQKKQSIEMYARVNLEGI